MSTGIVVKHLGGSSRGDRLERFAEPRIRIGRRPGNDVHFDPLQDLQVSADHAALQADAGTLYVEDLGSSNGTFVNGRRLAPREPAPILGTDRIRLGSDGPELAAMLDLAGEGPAAGLPTLPLTTGGFPPALPAPKSGIGQATLLREIGKATGRERRRAMIIAGATASVLLLVLVIVASTLGSGQEELEERIGRSGTPASLDVARVRDAVVRLAVLGQRRDTRQYHLLVRGSGFIWHVRDYIVTNRHVTDGVREGLELLKKNGVDGATHLYVYGRAQEKPRKPEIGWESDESDVAVLHLQSGDVPGLEPRLTRDVRQGERVWALGFPGAADVMTSVDSRGWVRSPDAVFDDPDFDCTVTDGVVSRIGKTVIGTAIQTNTAISGGNSGGPLVAVDGHVVGINTIAHKEIQSVNCALAFDDIIEEIDGRIREHQRRRN